MVEMSDSEEENYCFYGKALDPYDADSFPKKRPISVEEQVAKDAQGRRRFHGAFTGGFSAGFYNTVGSLEGWRPSEFKSSRADKAEMKVSKPEDFMDDEDVSEYGIAPQTVKATKDYSTSRKRKKQVFSTGPIPGEPVLHTLISNSNETIGYLLMKNMHLKKKSEIDNEDKVYGCVMPKTYEIQRTVDYEETIPDIYINYLKNPKSNTFGLGYSGLDKSSLNPFKSTQLVVKDTNNKKLSISGQAFGVGAFENDDDDIYAKDDMSQYDFELKSEAKAKKAIVKSDSVFDIFVLCKTPLLQMEAFAPPVIPQSFSGMHKIKKSRFEPLKEEIVPRKDLNASIRAQYLDEDQTSPTPSVILTQVTRQTQKNKQTQETKQMEHLTNHLEIKTERVDCETSDSSGLLFGKFVVASKEENINDIMEKVERSEILYGTLEMRDAAKMKLFGPLTRLVVDWQPCSLLCKRFNIPDPTFTDASKHEIKRKNHIIFEYQKNKDEELTMKAGLKSKEPVQETSISKPVETSILENPIEEPSTEVAESVHIPDVTERIDVSKNVDLFKAVFLSSSDSESDEDETTKEKETRNELLKTNIMTDLIPKIKTTKEGILSNIGQIKFSPFKTRSINPESEEDSVSKQHNIGDSNAYGPKLPESIQMIKEVFAVPKVPTLDEIWVEKDAMESKKVHKHKKHKKEKHRKKDHKSKHRK